MRTYQDLPLTLNASQVAETLGISRAGAYNLLHSKDFPTLRIGGRLIVPRDKFLHWLDIQTGGGHAQE